MLQLLRPAQLSQLECWSLDQDQQGLTSRPYPLASYYCLVLVRHPCLLSPWNLDAACVPLAAN